jgi:hypothetical protein
LKFRKQKKKKTEEKKSREEGTRRAHTPDKGGETKGARLPAADTYKSGNCRSCSW